MSFADACRFLFPRQAGRIKWSLGPTQALLDALGRPERHFASVHVGGTNGKGSTCAFLAAELEARGLRVGLYTSPHLVSVCERITLNGTPISEEAFAEWVTFLLPHIERVDASFFEAMTAIAFADLAARDADIAVVEVGLGGRLDATNVLTPLVSVVTKIALEHTEYLGHTLEAICQPASKLSSRLQAEGFRVHEFLMDGVSNYTRAVYGIRGILARGKFDVLNTHSRRDTVSNNADRGR